MPPEVPARPHKWTARMQERARMLTLAGAASRRRIRQPSRGHLCRDLQPNLLGIYGPRGP